MTIERLDLSALSRGGVARVGATADAPAAHVPLPALRWKTRILVPAGILVAAAAVLAYAGWDALTPATPVRVVPVIWQSGGEAGGGGGGGVLVQAPGWIEADPFAVGVSALADGVVREVLVLEGERVAAGQVVARLIDDEARIAADRAGAELAEARAVLLSGESRVQAAQSTWDNPTALRAAVATTEANLAERQAELERWPAELSASQARSEELAAEAERIGALLVKEQGTDIELLRARKQADAAAATADSIRRSKPILEAKLAVAQAERAAATENFKLRIADTRELAEANAGLAEATAALQRAEAMLADARLRLERMEIKSPVGGVVMARLVEPGSRLMLNADMPRANQVVRLYDPQKLQVRIDIPLSEAAKVDIGTKAEIVAQILPERAFHGVVTRIVHEADIQRNTLQVKVRIDDPSPLLKPEMLARAKFLGAAGPASRSAGATRAFVPREFVQHSGPGQAHVLVVNQSRQVAEMRAVTLGNGVLGDAVEVVDGLRPGDRVIAEDAGRVGDGSRIRIVGEAPASGGGSAQGGGGH